MFYLLIERLYNRRISLMRYEESGSYALQLVKCLSKQDAAEYAEERKAAGLSNDLVRGRLLITNLSLSAEAVRAVSQLYQAHEKYARERQELRTERQQVVVERATHSNTSSEGDRA